MSAKPKMEESATVPSFGLPLTGLHHENCEWESVSPAFSSLGATYDKLTHLKLGYCKDQENKFECHCDISSPSKFTNLKNLSNHILKSHCAGDKVCLLCSPDRNGNCITFLETNNAIYHAAQKHHLSLLMYYVCEDCQVVFPGVLPLKQHLTHQHKEEFNFESTMKFRCFPCFLCLSPFKSHGMRKSHLERKHGLFMPTKLENAGYHTPGDIVQIQELNKNFVAQNKLVRDLLSQCARDISSWAARKDMQKNWKIPGSCGETPKHIKPLDYSESLDLSVSGDAKSRSSQNTIKDSRSGDREESDLTLENPEGLDLTCNEKKTNGSSDHLELDWQPDSSQKLYPTVHNVNFSYLMELDSKHESSNTLDLAYNKVENVANPESKTINFMEVDSLPGIPIVSDDSDQNMTGHSLSCETQDLRESSSAWLDLATCMKSRNINLTSQTLNSFEENKANYLSFQNAFPSLGHFSGTNIDIHPEDKIDTDEGGQVESQPKEPPYVPRIKDRNGARLQTFFKTSKLKDMFKKYPVVSIVDIF